MLSTQKQQEQGSMSSSHRSAAAAVEGDTGGSMAGSLPVVDTRFRIAYLSFSLLSVFLISMGGYLVYKETNSLSIQLDFLDSGVDALALCINIGMEVVKSRVRHVRTVLMLDLVGCSLSLMLLVGVTIFGFVDATYRTHDPTSHLAHIDHLGIMVEYSMFIVVVTGTILFFFGYLKDLLLPASEVSDSLNMMSSVIHTAVDFGGNVVVLCTSLWLRYVTDKTHEQKGLHKMYIDAIGAFAVCFFLTVSIGLLGQTMRETWSEIRGLPPSPPESDAEAVGDSAAAEPSYGTMKEKQVV